MDKISVIVPIYNVEPYIERAVWSLLLQSWQEMEILLIDDGSTDRSGEICEEIRRNWESRHRNKHREIVIRHIPNGGQSHARNLGLALATGEMVGFLDGDDACGWTMFEQLHAAMTEERADIAECDFRGRWSAPGAGIPEDERVVLTGRDALEKQLRMEPASRFPSTSVWSKLFRKEILSDLRFPDGRIHEEYAFLAEAFLRAGRYVYLGARLYDRTLRGDSTTAETFSIRSLDKLAVYQRREEFLAAEAPELLDHARARRYDLMMHSYYLCREHGMKEEARQLRRGLLASGRDILAGKLPGKKKMAFCMFVCAPGMYEQLRIWKRNGGREAWKRRLCHLVYRLHRLGPDTVRVRSMEETIAELAASERSMVRYGDGEFLMMQGHDISEQRADAELGRRLQEVLRAEDPRILYCVCNIFHSLDACTPHSRCFWEAHLLRHRREYRRSCGGKRQFYDALVTRPYFMLEDKLRARTVFDRMKQLWHGRDLVIIEGGISHNGVGNDLFAEAGTVRRIIVPSRSCYTVYDRILEAARRLEEQNVLFLVSIGAASKVLVYDLVQDGCRALDIGNLDMEYEWSLHGASGKYQLLKHDIEGEALDRELGYETYLGEVVERIPQQAESDR